jgi:hypothetical protein
MALTGKPLVEVNRVPACKPETRYSLVAVSGVSFETVAFIRILLDEEDSVHQPSASEARVILVTGADKYAGLVRFNDAESRARNQPTCQLEKKTRRLTR